LQSEPRGEIRAGVCSGFLNPAPSAILFDGGAIDEVPRFVTHGV
jgi:hypothetical protein